MIDQRFLKEIDEEWGNSATLVPNALKVNIQDIDSEKVISAVNNLAEYIEGDELPALPEGVDPLELLFEKGADYANICEEMLELVSDEINYNLQFKFKGANYLTTKTELENYNALELASTIAYSRPILPLIPQQSCHPFHSKAATDSGESCHPLMG